VGAATRTGPTMPSLSDLMLARDATAAAVVAALSKTFPRGFWGTIRVTVEDGQVRRDNISLELKVK
jgi:hypothetical protein